jgi:hypothetical protein
MTQNQRNRLGVFVNNESQKILAINFLQETEGQGFDRLPDVIQGGACVFSQRSFDQMFGKFQTSRSAHQGVRIRAGKIEKGRFLLVAREIADFGDFNGNRFHLFRL